MYDRHFECHWCANAKYKRQCESALVGMRNHKFNTERNEYHGEYTWEEPGF